MAIRLNIHKRLSMVLWSAALLAFVAAGAAFALVERLTLETRVRQIMAPYAQLVSVGTDAAVAFEDPVRAQEILDTLRVNPQIREAEIFLSSGRILASIDSLAHSQARMLPVKPNGITIQADTAELLQDLPSGGRLRLSMSLEQLNRQTRQALGIFGAGALVLLIATLAQLAVLRRTIARPIASLTQATEWVRTTADYGQRVPATGADEVARLGQNFNAMMQAIQDREEDLRRLTVFQRTILDNVAYAIVSTTPDGVVTSYNPAAERLLGYAAGEVVGRQTPALWHDPEEMNRHAMRLSGELGEPISPGFTVFTARPSRNLAEENEWTFIRRDGVRIPVNLSITALRNEDGQISGFVGLAYDLSERKQTEKSLTEYAAIVESTDDAVIGKTLDGIITSWNKGAERMFGYSADEIIGQSIAMLIPDGRRDEEGEILKTVRGGEPVRHYETVRLCKDGRLIDVSVTVSPLKNPQGRIIGAAKIARDITARKQVEDELGRYREQLEDTVKQRTAELLLTRDAAEAANKAKSAFLANMSHELRTPLNAILGFSAIMRKNPRLCENDRNIIDIINRSGEHLLSLINDVLEMAKIEAGRVQLEAEPFDLGEMVRDVTEMMQVRATEKNLRLTVDQSSEFPRYIVGDQARLRQVLINLVGNALKFTRQGGVIIRLTTKNNAVAHLQIEVEDTGPGIAPEDQQRIFEPFVQLGKTANNKGTGLGLSITRQFVQLMKGNISLESMPGKGSLFRIDLPMGSAEAIDIGKLQCMEEREVLRMAPGQSDFRILVVEDQLDNQLLLANLLERVGFRVKLAGDGRQAVEIFQTWHPHFIWMDRQMPVMDGLEAARIIRRLPGGREVKIVAVTASAFTEQRTEMLAAGMDDFVRKPYHAFEIYECLSKHLGVRFEYAETQAAEKQNPVLNAAMLSALPRQLRQDLESAVISLESERINGVIQRIAAYDQELKNMLNQLAYNYDYPAILNALRSGRDQYGK